MWGMRYEDYKGYCSMHGHTRIYVHVYTCTYKYGHFRLGCELLGDLYRKSRDTGPSFHT